MESGPANRRIGQDLTEDTLASLRTEMQKFSLNFDPSDYHDVYSFKYVLEGEIWIIPCCLRLRQQPVLRVL